MEIDDRAGKKSKRDRKNGGKGIARVHARIILTSRSALVTVIISDQRD